MNTLVRISRKARSYAGKAGLPLDRLPRIARQRLLFLFCGQATSVRDPGRRLYRDEPLFRGGIDAAEPIVREMLGFSPKAAFAGDWLPPSWDEERRSDIVIMALAQMGLADLWRESGGVEPGFLGLSGGEVAAAYGAGILSRDESVRTICAIARHVRHPDGRCSTFMIEAPARKAKWICRSSPHQLEFGGEVIPGISNLQSPTSAAADNRALLEGRVRILSEHHASYRYHVPESGVDEEKFAACVPFTSSSLAHSPLYFCSFGGRVPDGHRFDWRHWAWMLTSSYRMAAASVAACRDGFNCVVLAGPDAIGEWHLETARRVGVPQRMFRPFDRKGGDEVAWASISARLDSLKLAPPAASTVRIATRKLPDLADPVHLADPFGVYEALRERGPVHYLARQKFWIVLGHEEMKAACAQPAIFSNAPYDFVDRVLIGEDPPRHAAVRRIIARHFDAATVGRLEAYAGELSKRLLAPRLDVVAEYAAPFSRGIAAQLIGLDEEGIEAIVEATETAQDETEPFDAITRSLDRLAERTLAYRRIHEESNGLFDDGEVRSLVRFLWLAAITTTERVISRSAMRLIEDDALLGRLRGERRLIGPFIEEVLRLNPPEHMLPRRTMREAKLGGVSIPAGAEVQLCTTAANRDPAVFDAPTAFRLDRKAGHLAFGSGIHHCSGTALARRLIPVAVGALIDAPGFRAIQPIETIEYHMTVKTLVPRHFVIGT